MAEKGLLSSRPVNVPPGLLTGYEAQDAGLLTGGAPQESKWDQFLRGLKRYPAHVAQQLLETVKAPGDAYSGKLQVMDPTTGHVSDEALGAASGLAGLVMTGGVGGAPKGAVGSGPIKAYHGSPHDFDRFDLSKIGTGEGAQAYGHGLYFAEKPEVAQGYKQTLERRNIAASWDGQPIEKWAPVADKVSQENWRVGKILDDYGRLGGDPEKFIRGQRDWYRGQKDMEAAIDEFAHRIKATHTPGRMYEVAIHADPERFLDWDKPLSASGVRDAVADLPRELRAGGGLAGKRLPDDPTGADLYHAMRSGFAAKRLGYDNWSSSGPSKALNERGVEGIKYLDAGSRGAGDGSRNLVVFNDEIVEILRKYGIAGLAMLPPSVLAAAGISSQPAEATQ